MQKSKAEQTSLQASKLLTRVKCRAITVAKNHTEEHLKFGKRNF